MNAKEHTRKRRLLGKALVCGFVLAALCSFFPFAAACGQLPRDVVRLHVVANSNGAEDQAVKLLVRDAVLEEAARWYQGAGSMEEASSHRAKRRTSSMARQMTTCLRRLVSRRRKACWAGDAVDVGLFTGFQLLPYRIKIIGEFRAVAPGQRGGAVLGKCDSEDCLHPSGPGGKHNDPVRCADGLGQVVRH